MTGDFDLKITPKERQQNRLSPTRLADATRQVREAGFVILENALSAAWVEGMRGAFEEELEQAVPDRGKNNGNRGGCSAPLRMPFLDPLAVENPFGLPIIEALMGKGIWAFLPYHTNTSWPGANMQPIHRDTQQLFPDLPFALPPTLMIIHIPLVDFTEENGSTEVWPGTHLITDIAPGDSEPESLARRAERMPSVRTNMPAGSVVVRDMRVWHRGMPNHTDQVRTMLSIVYFRQLHRFPTHLTDLPAIPREAMDLLPERARQIYRYNPIEKG
jgi:ectoine hydroxylase-related dioxygenase (phytanoyl-CoA dioxygenase family)